MTEPPFRQWAVFYQEDADAERQVDSYFMSKTRAMYRAREIRQFYALTEVVEVVDVYQWTND